MNIDDNNYHKFPKHYNIDSLLITVITVSYNAEKGIERTILSVIEQECANFEFIIVDGNSKDNTLNIVNKYRNHITKIINEPDKGLYDAMNKGIDFSSGDYIIFLNADDMLRDKFVIRDVVNFIANSNSDIDALYGNAVYELEKKNITIKPKNIDLIVKEMIFSHQSVFVRRTILEKYKFNLTFKYVADYNQLSSIYMDGYKFHYLDRDISISATGSGITYENVYNSVREHYSIDRFKKNPFSKLAMCKVLVLKKLVHTKATIISNFNSIIKK